MAAVYDDGFSITQTQELEYLRDKTPFDAIVILNCHGIYKSVDVKRVPDGIHPTIVSLAQYGVESLFTYVPGKEVNGYGMSYKLIRAMIRKTMVLDKSGPFLKRLVPSLRRIFRMYKYSHDVHKETERGFIHDDGWHVSTNGSYLEKVYQPFSDSENASISISMFLTHPLTVVDAVLPHQITRTELIDSLRRYCSHPLILDASCSTSGDTQPKARETRLVRNRLKRDGVAMGGSRKRKKKKP